MNILYPKSRIVIELQREIPVCRGAKRNKTLQERKGALLYAPVESIVHPCSLHSRSAEENCPTGNVLSRPSVKGAAPPCAANAAIPCGHVSKFEHNVLEVLIWTKKLMIARADVQTDYKLHISFRLAFIHFAIAHKRKSPETLRFQDLVEISGIEPLTS